MSATRHTFSKAERLRSRKLLEQIIAEGKSVHASPFRLSWVTTGLTTGYPVQVAIAVPKRNLKRAVDRNRVKRLFREVYRTNKSGLYTFLESRKLSCAMLVVYNGRKVPEYREVENKFLLTLRRFEETIVKNSG